MAGDIYEGVGDHDPCEGCGRQDCACGDEPDRPWMEVTTRKVWVTTFTCPCGRRTEMWHHGERDAPTEASYPSSGEWNGWDLRDGKCPSCASGVDRGTTASAAGDG